MVVFKRLLFCQIVLCEDAQGNKYEVKRVDSFEKPVNLEEVIHFTFFVHFIIVLNLTI